MMGKRSDFKRIDKDCYDTIDPRAVAALLPHLDVSDGFHFLEPCAGRGCLVDALEAAGGECILKGDIAPRREDITHFDATCPKAWAERPKIGGRWRNVKVITNPPWNRPELHQIISLWSQGYEDFWLLFDADWAHTQQARPLLRHCRNIVSIGRLKWIPETTMTGKDNCAWYNFDPGAEGLTYFHGRAA